jgi:hypothetical protein
MANRSRRSLLLACAIVATTVGCNSDGGIAPPLQSTRAALPFQVGSQAALAVVTVSLPGGQVAQPYTLLNQTKTSLVATGGTRPITWALTQGTLPAGLTLNPATGDITGTPTTKGTSAGLVFTATDATGATAQSRAMSIFIDDPHFAVFILGRAGVQHPGADARSGAAQTITLFVTYTKNGTRLERRIALNIPANADPAAVLNAFLPAIQAALGADFDVSLVAGAANPRIEIVAKAGVTLGSSRPNFGGQVPNVNYQLPSGSLRIAVNLSNAQ